VIRLLLGFALGLIVRLLRFTWRVEVRSDGGLSAAERRRFVYAFWHGAQLGLLALPLRGATAVLVSRSKDGTLQHGAMRALGLHVVRGSSSNGAAAGLKGLVRRMRGGHDAAFAVDGPRGPRARAKPGAASAAFLAGGVCIPLGCAAERAYVVPGTWDAFRIPLPFSRVCIWLGAPWAPERSSELAFGLGAAIDDAERRAAAALLRARSDVEERACPRG
jgi:lysophospholipid acyltransferase (LPLAT)-like uncharacterized protein